MACPRAASSSLLVTPFNKKSASYFSNDGNSFVFMHGVGITFNRPWSWQHRPPAFNRAKKSSKSNAHGSLRQQYAALLDRTRLCHHFLHEYPETLGGVETSSVQFHHLRLIAEGTQLALGKNWLIFASNISLNTAFGVNRNHNSYSVVNGTSQPDGFIEGLASIAGKEQMFTRGIWEVKGSHAGLEFPLRQAFAEATYIAAMHIARGVKAADVCVPIVVSNGRYMQFALLAMLPPSFPYLIALTYPLDLCIAAQRGIAAQHMCIIDFMMRESLELHNESPVELSLDISRYHIKYLKYFFEVRSTREASLEHMFSVLDHLAVDSELRHSVAFPITIRSRTAPKDAAQGSHDMHNHMDMLVFDNLAKDGYRIGFPNDDALCEKLVKQIKAVVARIHARGVVHMDLYPSNIMWRLNATSRSIDVKIIDWDAAHFVGECFTQEVLAALEKAMWRTQLYLDVDGTRAVCEYDNVFVGIMHDNYRDPSLRTDNKSELDQAFQQMCHAHAQMQRNKKVIKS